MSIELKKPELIQGYTEEQWGIVKKKGFLVQISSDGKEWSQYALPLTGFNPTTAYPFVVTFWKGVGHGSLGSDKFAFCRPYRVPGIRQPWFGGYMPIDPSCPVIVTYADGRIEVNLADDFTWVHTGKLKDGRSYDIVEFSYYPEAKS